MSDDDIAALVLEACDQTREPFRDGYTTMHHTELKRFVTLVAIDAERRARLARNIATTEMVLRSRP